MTKAASEPKKFKDSFPVDLNLHNGEFDKVVTDEKITKAYETLAYDFVWETMTEETWNDKVVNWLKEVWFYPKVDNNDKGVRTFMEGIAGTDNKEYEYQTTEKIIYAYNFEIDDTKLLLALYILEDKPIFTRKDFREYKIADNKPYTLLGFYRGRDDQILK